jgi:hypothetical protein
LFKGCEPNSDPRTIWHLPFNIRKQLSFELDNADKKEFHFMVGEIIKDLDACKIESLRKSPSPTMALLEELETMCPCLPVSRVRDACYKGKRFGAVKIMDSHIRKKSFQGRRIRKGLFLDHVDNHQPTPHLGVSQISGDSAIEQDSEPEML